MTTTVYVAGPMTGIPDHNFPAFNAAEDRLVGLGFEVHNPATKGVIEGWTWEDYMRVDLRELTLCDGIFLLNGWWKSPGAKLEQFVASSLNMTILFDYLHDADLLRVLRSDVR